MGCSASIPSSRPPPPSANVPTAVTQQAEAVPPPGIQQGSHVQYEGHTHIIQYITSKGALDLKSASTGDVLYGIAKADVVAINSTNVGVGTNTNASLATAAAPAPADTTHATMTEKPALELVGEPLAKPGGSGAKVYCCRLDGKDPFAVKLLPTSARSDQLAVIRAEAALCVGLRHENIVSFVHCAPCHSVSGVAHCVITMELLPVSLDAICEARQRQRQQPWPSTAGTVPFSLDALRGIAASLAEALCYLHAGPGGGAALLHRDVKPANVFFEGASADGTQPIGRLRLGDFDVGTRAVEPLVEFTGTPSVSTPPEMWRHAQHYTPADIWALGMTLQWCLCLTDPLEHATMSELEERLCAEPSARIPIFDEAPARGEQDQEELRAGGGTEDGGVVGGVTAESWPASLAPVAALARRCCCSDPASRPTAEALRGELRLAAPG